MKDFLVQKASGVLQVTKDKLEAQDLQVCLVCQESLAN